MWLPRGERDGDLLGGAGAALPGLREERRGDPRLGDDRLGDVVRCGLPRRESRRPGDREPRLDREADRRGLPCVGAAQRRWAEVDRVAEYIFS